MILTIICISIGVVLLGAFFWRASKGVARPLEGLDFPIRGLLRQGYDGGFLVINRYRASPFVQLRKYIHGIGDYGIELAFPLADWAEPYRAKLEEILKELGLEYELQDNRGLLFIYVDFERDVALAHSVVVAILTRVFSWSKDTRCFTLMENADPRDVLIDR